MAINVAINGFGRIGRNVFRVGFKERKLNFVAINDLTDTQRLATLLKYDSVYGKFPGKISYTKDSLIVNGKTIKVFAERNPSKLPWKRNKIDIVVESTGFFRDRINASKHLKAGAKKVLISAPSKNPDMTILIGVNHKSYDKKRHHIVSKASCTTTCLGPMVKVLHDAFGIEKGFFTTVHAYVGDQKLVDAPHKDIRRMRAAAMNMIPTTTGAAKAVVEVIPELKGQLDGMAVRVPVICGSLTDFTAIVKKSTTVEQVNSLFKKMSNGPLKGIIDYSEEPLVSRDIIGNSHSVVFDAPCTKVNGNLVKIFGWYDNELGYSYRMVDVLKRMM